MHTVRRTVKRSVSLDMRERCDYSMDMGKTTNNSNFGWHSTLASQLATVASHQRSDDQNADDQVTELLVKVAREWRVMVKDVRFSFYGGVDSPERQRAYTARRVAETRSSIARAYADCVLPPSWLALDEALEAVEIEIAV